MQSSLHRAITLTVVLTLIGMSAHGMGPAWKKAPPAPAPPQITEYDHQRIYSFNDEEGIEKINGDPGLTVGIENGEYRVHGTTTDTRWGPDAVQVPIDDKGGAVDVSGTFRIETRKGSGLVFIEANTKDNGPIIMMYQWAGWFNAYQIQRRWFRGITFELANGRDMLGARGNETEVFNTMRLHIRPDHKHVDFYVNDDFFDTLVFEQPLSPIVSAKMELQTPVKGAEYDIRFDDLTVRQTADH